MGVPPFGKASSGTRPHCDAAHHHDNPQPKPPQGSHPAKQLCTPRAQRSVHHHACAACVADLACLTSARAHARVSTGWLPRARRRQESAL